MGVTENRNRPLVKPSPRRAARYGKLAVAVITLALAHVLGAKPARLTYVEPLDEAVARPFPAGAWDPAARIDAVVVRPRPRHVRPGVRFSFAVISDTNEGYNCDVAQGPKVAQAVRRINALNPDFVVGVGDLAAGGGDCITWGKGYPDDNLEHQLARFKTDVLEHLAVPFVPVSGNHELSTAGSRDLDYPYQTWLSFWKVNSRYVLPEARPGLGDRSQRFTYQGVGFVLLGYYGTLGLHPKELRFAQRAIRPADVVFRHVNPYGITCANPWSCGYALRSWPTRHFEKLTDLLTERDVTALFSGHTHGFYDGVCDGLRFVNTGSLGDRSMEYIKGWAKSPFAKRQAFVWVDVLSNASLHITFYVWDPARQDFRPFDNRNFPPLVHARHMEFKTFSQGVEALCHSNRRAPTEVTAFFADRDEAPRPKR